MKTIRIFIGFSVIVLLNACSSGDKTITEEEQMRLDSISRANQARAADSMKKLNPLLIVPPDSSYTGDYLDKYPNGIVKFRGFFRFGERHGQWIAFYENGMPWSEQEYDKGLKSGINKVYYENGKLRYAGYFKNDKRDSIWVFYDTLGNQIKTLKYKDGREL
ncbi:MAG: toxin-antitoxin system YwqK family antitoxin [Bacteroidia bacterium]